MDARTIAGYVVAWMFVSGVWAFVVMAHDKRAARRRGARRVPEASLLWAAMLGGAWGGWAAMVLLRHKTRHLRFRVLVPAAALLWTAFVVWLWTAGRGALGMT